ncbi:MAG: outer membrane beta-barrel protein [Bacteroidaceae bacterium]|nr:outer membrane beta-barrel protein [Bacteroidaceae bacterium]
MKTRFFALALLFAGLTLGASAQSYKYPSFHMGLRGGFSTNSFSENGKSLLFPQGGIAADFRVAPIPLYFETGAYYMNKGAKDYEKVSYSYYSLVPEKEDVDDHTVYAPVLLSYHLYLNDNMAVQPFAGATVGYGFDSEDVEAAIRIGCGFNLGRLYANLGYDIGMTKHDGWPKKYKNNTFFMTIGFNWAGGR